MDSSRGLHALEFVQWVFEKAKGLKAAIEHEVLTHQPVRVGQALREPAGFGHQQQARRFASVGANNNGLRLLENFAPVPVKINGAGNPAVRVQFDLARVRIGPDFAAAGLLRHRNHGGERARFRTHLTTERFTETAMHAGATAAIGLREDRHRRGERVETQLARGTLENRTGRFHRQRR